MLVRLREPQALPVGRILAAQIAAIGACRLRLVEQSALGLHFKFKGLDDEARSNLDSRLSKIRSENTEFIDRAISAANRISGLFEDAITQRKISLDDLFDNSYVPIPETNPMQYRTRFLTFVEEMLPDIQEPLLASDKRMVFCAAVDRNGYLPVHNKIYSQPQRAGEVIWNTANCRNQRIFDDRAGLSAGRVVRPYLIQNYPRQMGDRIDMMWRLGLRFEFSGNNGAVSERPINYDANPVRTSTARRNVPAGHGWSLFGVRDGVIGRRAVDG